MRKFMFLICLIIIVVLSVSKVQATPSYYETYVSEANGTACTAEFGTPTTYYVAQSGGNDNWDGLAPAWTSGSHGPFASANPLAALSTTVMTSAIKVNFRTGTYVIPGDDGIPIAGGDGPTHPVILSGYLTETAVLDAGTATDSKAGLILTGNHITVENLTIKDAPMYNIRVHGDCAIIRNNILEGARDSIKVLIGADHGLIQNNDISGFEKNGIDQFGAEYWLVKGNNIHHSAGEEGATSGMLAKGGSRYSVIVDNDIHDLDVENEKSTGLMLGGSSAYLTYHRIDDSEYLPEGTLIVAEDNRIWNVAASGIQFYGCVDCRAERNAIYSTLYGISILRGNDPEWYGSDDPEEAPTSGAIISDNNFFDITSNYVFILQEGADTGLDGDGNTYYSDVAPEAIYYSPDAFTPTVVEYAESETFQGLLDVVDDDLWIAP